MILRLLQRLVVACFLVTASLGASTAWATSCDDWREVGDVLRYALPAAAYGLSLGYRDGQGAYQFTKTLAYTGAAAGTFKKIGGKTRPDAGTSEQSFVSGHVASSMAGAAFIYTRYGKGWGIPAYVLAGATAYSRYCADKHFDDDILGGTMVALMSNWYATSPYKGNTELFPSFTSNDLRLSWRTFFGGNRQPREPSTFRPRYKVTFEFGPVFQETNIVESPSGSGNIIDLASLEKKTAPTARLLVEWFPKNSPDQDWSIYYSPLGITDFEEPDEPFEFAGTTFDPEAFEVFNTNYRWFDWRLRWRKALINNNRWTVRAGAGFQYLYTKVEVEQGVKVLVIDQAEVSTNAWAPVIHGSVDWKISQRWKISAQVDGMTNFWDSDDNGYYWNTGLFVNFAASPIWDLGLGTRWIIAKGDEPQLYNEFKAYDITFQLGRSF
jgi:membrane-associated phospholipid phosphatase